MKSFANVVRTLSLFCLLALASDRAHAGASMALQFGMEAGGELYRVVSPDPFGGTTYIMPSGDGLLAAEFRTELEENVSFGLRVRIPFRKKFNVSVALTAADMDVTAIRRAPTTGSSDDVLYDQMFALHGDVCLEYDWLEEGNRPFLALGVGFVSMDFEERSQSGVESLDQTPVAWIVGGGFRVRSLAAMDFDIEARGYRVAPDWDAEEERLVPAESFTGKDGLWLWQVSVAAVYEF